MKDKRDIILGFCSNPDAVLNALHQEGWQVIPKPAASPATASDLIRMSDGNYKIGNPDEVTHAIATADRSVGKDELRLAETLRDSYLEGTPGWIKMDRIVQFLKQVAATPSCDCGEDTKQLESALRQIKAMVEYDAKVRGQWRFVTQEINTIIDAAMKS